MLDVFDVPYYPSIPVFQPSANVTIDEWADSDRVLTSATSNETGRWKTSTTPYLREIMQALSPQHPAKRVVFMKCTQSGGTEVAVNAIGHRRKHDPTTCLVVLPTDASAVAWSKSRVATLFETSFGDEKFKGSDTIYQKDYPGGSIKFASAASPATLKSNAVDLAVIDEADEFPVTVGTQGCPIALVDARQATYPFSKMYIVSSPTDEETSRIYREFLDSNQQYLYVPCPSCEVIQTIDWENIHYVDDDPSTARWGCKHCGVLHDESAKAGMVAKYRWIAHNPGHEVEGFFINAFYIPWVTWADTVNLWLKAQKNPNLLAVFTNTVRGLPTKSQAIEAPSWTTLYDRREQYQIGTVPDGPSILTAGVDVQGDRLEMEVLGWAPGYESWSIDYRVFPGDPYHEAVWDDLEEALKQIYPASDGLLMPITRTAIDTGYATTEVYNFLRRFNGSQAIIAVKSQDSMKAVTGQRPTYIDFDHRRKTYKSGALLWSVGSSTIKEQIYGYLELEVNDDGSYPAGYCHFPEYDAEYFEMLTAEKQKLVKNKKGYLVKTWVKERDRNEALDTRVYARAALETFGVARWQPHHWAAHRQKYRLTATTARSAPGGVQAPSPAIDSGTDFWSRY